MEVRLLGEVEVRSAGRPLDLGTPQQQVVLAVLVVNARRPVAMEALVDRVWGDDPPANPRPVLYAHLSRIRGLLRQATGPGGAAAARVERRQAGYVLEIDPELVDLHRFRRLVEQGDDRPGDDAASTATLAEALDMWRGEPLAGLPGAWAAQVRTSWHQRRLDALVRWAQAEFRLGRPAAVISAVPDLTAEYPLAEPLEHVLIQSLHAAGRGAEALDRYGVVRRRLAEELGTGPGEELRTLYRTVLAGDRPPPRPASVTDPRSGPAPAAAPTVAAAAAATTPTVAAAAVTDGAPLAVPHGTSHGAFAGASVGSFAGASVDASAGVPPRAGGTFRRRALLTALAAVVLPVATSAAHALRRDECGRGHGDGPPAVSVERAWELFATAEAFDQEGKAHDARAAVVDAVWVSEELVELAPDRSAPALAPAVLRALGRAGVDFGIARSALLDRLGDPVRTPYPAISHAILLRGWRFTAPVFLDAVVRNYEHTAGPTSPRHLADVHTDTLKAAVLESTRTRHGTRTTEFDQLLAP
ncbi:BTAD domain-containing putative transcriptional regulator [Kitasatospora purpeofusca]|uniref:BTAD domain-containing putative transcriptional regulator n=1 Tax=Kitasatospora purpeofusca TaxID=67352 RepID=UPI003800476F